MPNPAPLELSKVVKAALKRLASKGYNYTGRKVYTLAEFNWDSTYGFGEGYSKPERGTPAGVYMIEGSPCRGVLTVRLTWQGWLVNFVNDHIHRKFIVKALKTARAKATITTPTRAPELKEEAPEYG